MGQVIVTGLTGIPEVRAGDDIAEHIITALGETTLEDGDLIVITHKIVSKAEGRAVPIEGLAAYRAIVESEAVAVLRRRHDLLIAQTRHGFICANAGVDRSNVQAGFAITLPLDPDRSARRILAKLQRVYPIRIGIVITDTFGRPWRRGLTDVAIGVAGLEPIEDLRGTADAYGNILDVTEVSIADEVAAAADLAMGKASAIPVALVRGVEWTPGPGSIQKTIRSVSQDLFR